jgi:hypothetical protein
MERKGFYRNEEGELTRIKQPGHSPEFVGLEQAFPIRRGSGQDIPPLKNGQSRSKA